MDYEATYTEVKQENRIFRLLKIHKKSLFIESKAKNVFEEVHCMK